MSLGGDMDNYYSKIKTNLLEKYDEWAGEESFDYNQGYEKLGIILTLVSLSIGLLYSAYNIIAQIPLSFDLFTIVILAGLFFTSTIFLLVVHLLIRGYLLSEGIEAETRKILIVFSSYVYKASFYLFIIGVIDIITLYSNFKKIIPISLSTIGFLGIIVGILLTITFLYYSYKKHEIFTTNNIAIVALIIIEFAISYFMFTSEVIDISLISIILILTMYVFIFLLSIKDKAVGNIILLIVICLLLIVLSINSWGAFVSMDIEMDNTYQLEQSPMPIAIKVTGLNNMLKVNLHTKDKSSFEVNDGITFSNRTSRIIEQDSRLFGVYLDNGEYDIYINTTSMNPGLYLLNFTVQQHTESKTFYLIDDGKEYNILIQQSPEISTTNSSLSSYNNS